MNDKPTVRSRELRRRGFGFPLALIAVGLVALLANYGILGPVSWVSLLGLWPLILVLIGIDLLLAHRAPALALAGDVAVIALGVALALTRPVWIAFPSFSFSGTDCGGDRASSVSAPRDGVKDVSLRVAAGATRLVLGGGASGLLEATSTASDLRLDTRTPRSATGVELRLDQCLGAAPFGRDGSNEMRVQVAGDVPLSLDVSAGAATIDLDLRDVTVSDVRVSTGAATVNLLLPKPSGDLRVAISSGASTINVQLPPGVESRVTLSGGLSTLNGGRNFAGRNASESPGYARARDRVTVTVNAGMSTVNVR